MTQQGERHQPDDRDEPPAWWSQLYDEGAEDTGRSATGDTLDDRFYSASQTLGSQRTLAPPEGRPDSATPSAPQDRAAAAHRPGEPEPGSTPEPSREPNSEPNPEPSREPNSEPSREPNRGPNREPNREPAPEPSREPNREPNSEPSREPAPEPNPEPSREPNSEPSREPNRGPNREPDPEPRGRATADTTAPHPLGAARPPAEGTADRAPEPDRSAEDTPGARAAAEPTGDQATLFLPAAEPRRPAAQRTRDPRKTPGPAQPPVPPVRDERPTTAEPDPPVTDPPTPAAPSPAADAPAADAPAPSAPTPGSLEPAAPPAAPRPSTPARATVVLPRTVPRAAAPAGRPEGAEKRVRTAPDALPPADPGDLAALVSDTVLESAQFGSATLRAVSTRGAAARQVGAPRGDALLVARFGTGNDALVLVAVAAGPAVAQLPAPQGGAAAGAFGPRVARAACHWIAEAVGRSHARLVEDIRAERRGALKSGLQRLTGRGYGKARAEAAELGLDPREYTADLRCLLVPGDPRCRIRVFFGVGSGGLFRLRDGHWQDIEPSVPATAEVAAPAPGQPAAPPDPRTAPMASPHTPAELAAADGFQPASAPVAPPFRFRASAARPGDVLLLCGSGLAEPLRADQDFAHQLADRWAGSEPPDPADFLGLTQRSVAGHTADRTAAALWES